MEYNNVVSLLVIAIVIIGLVNISAVYIKISQINKEVTGYSMAVVGYVNVTINSALYINISRTLVQWGSGITNTTNVTCNNVTLTTVGDGTGVIAPSCCGNWSGANAQALVVSNIGNTNCSIKISSSANASDMFGALPGQNQSIEINVSNKNADTCGSTGAIPLSSWSEINKTNPGTVYCNQVSYLPNSNTVYIDFKLTVPMLSNSTVYDNARTAQITITGDTAI